VTGPITSPAYKSDPNARPCPTRDVARAKAIRGSLRDSGRSPDEIGHVHAHGLATASCDADEARAIRQVFGERPVPVTAAKSYFGNLGAGSGAVELAASVLAIARGEVPPTLNYEHPDSMCPLNVIHRRPMSTDAPAAVVLNPASTGQAAALALLPDCPERLERARAAQGLEGPVDRPRIDGDHQRDRPPVGGEHRLTLALEGVANLLGACPEVPDRERLQTG